MSKPKVIAFYLPQYHPTPDNDKWWGKGFTEWTNVGKARSLFPGHYQPKVPADLGYYDLRLPEIREAQAELAKEAGIYGFCYYHYWFGNGKEELELPFNEVMRLGEPDFPFMLCWANESWHKKFWDKDGKGSSKEMLIEQKYPGDQDIIDHFYRLLPAFKDPRYIRIDNKPAFMIYKPELLPDDPNFLKIWNDLALKEGLDGIFFIAYDWENLSFNYKEELESKGYNAVTTFSLWKACAKSKSVLNKVLRRLRSLVGKWPTIYDFKKVIEFMFTEIDGEENVFPTIIPNWDHTPRSGGNGIVVENASPEVFGIQINKLLEITKKKDNNIIFLKSWNEWGEGNYMEPDLRYGKRFINVLADSIDKETCH